MIPTKYLKSDKARNGWGCYHSHDDGEAFRHGSAKLHADYLTEMKARHPIMYFCWYRWWIPTLLHEDERKDLDHYMHVCRQYRHRPFWAEFSMFHPVQYLLFFLSALLFQSAIKCLTAPIKVFKRVFPPPVTEDGLKNVLLNQELVEQNSNVP